MADGAGSSSGSRPGQYGGNVPRRLSYASVASGATSQNLPAPPRSGLFSHLANSTPSGGLYLSLYNSEHPQQRRYSNEQDSPNSSYWRKAPSLPAYSRKFANIPALGTGNMPASQFFIPSYLRASRHVAKLEAAHKAKVRKEREHPTGGSSAMGSLSTSAGNTNVHRIAPSHRGMTYDIIESNPPKEEEQLMPLPSRWSEQDRYPGLDVMNDGLDLKYSGTVSKADIEAASVRADYPMSPACGIYYFEVEIKHKSKDTAIAIGFSTAEASLERLPGWETHSWGYHGDDGKMFFGEHSGRNYGPTFGAGDIIGCGVNFNAGHAFFTKNGQDLGICFRELKKDVRPFPTIGMKKHSGALITVNFGQHPFVFDIDDKMETEKSSVAKDIAKAKPSSLQEHRDESSLVQELVMQFLAHDGYVETAKAFAEEIQKEKDSLSNTIPSSTAEPVRDDTDAVHRQRIRRALLSGDIDRALECTHAQFPTVLAQNPSIVFRLKCRKWVELIGKTTELNTRKPVNERKASNGFGRTSATDDDFAQDMELDDQPQPQTTSSGLDKSAADETMLQHDQLLIEAMQYGQELMREYRDEEGDYAKALEDIFSLVAYNDPKDSVHGHLLDPSGRVTVAEELNSAILVSLGRSPSAALERTWKQTETFIDMLEGEGGPAAFVNLRAQFDA
ncbi:hypothetical protein LTR47_000459 [Exophiala xenobiotica]|nr:hypothetical protein LTR72_002097 [Exophiala xenobiotica]KAK5238716.1 hypothetical protein LTR47_000459 [Exophiala xenobiotica]KAK5255637.1 hypothetical protein LTS06_000093 [Exophiala xenobiotica]KAK5302351.1 hypothetical protein LTR14_000600 [Exophiala xenobiotica]KAK5350146.1 hypothetical protein LTR61_006121 [Exophiala xenobiotica]